ncbi:MAG: tyrosine-protein phosphatase [Bifidobacteriaceae bacterium]|jgi:protein-tyrosine phosphatase|nr:tyrosine-protein phosphatase [Bifidobacteriaceae bacterium]
MTTANPSLIAPRPVTAKAGPAIVVASPLPVEGTFNLRDTGGYPTENGGQTRRDRLFRSDGLHALTDSGRAALRQLNLRHIVDLRAADEIRQAPSATAGLGASSDHLALFGPASSATEAVQPGPLAGIYGELLTQRGSRLADAVRLIVRRPLPLLVHCTAGKDRTGLVIALTLDAIGVRREAVVADYAASELNLAGAWFDSVVARFASQGIGPAELIPHWLSSPPGLIAAVLDHLDRDWGGAAGYLVGHGLALKDLTVLSRRLTC